MHRALVTCVPVLVVLAACVHDSNTSRPAAPAAPTPAATPPATTPAPDMAAPVSPAPAPPPQAPTAAPSVAPAAGAPTGKEAAAAGAATTAPAVRSGSTSSKPAKAPTAAASGTSAAPAGSAVPATTPATAAPPPAASAAALDLNGLEQRLRDTHAIGVFTKLTLKNQVDDLLGKFKSFHQGQSHVTLAQLRQQYEVLLLKVISLLQDDDPSLASAVSSSREAIWGVLTDPKKFANI